MWRKFAQFVRNFNIFKSVPPSINEHDLKNERISTRLFIVLLIISLTILLLYNSLINIIQTNNIKKPTFEQYSQLYSLYQEVLTCPCTQILIDYEKFIRLDYTLHQVCSSVFVSQNWIDHLGYPYFAGTIYTDRLSSFRYISISSIGCILPVD